MCNILLIDRKMRTMANSVDMVRLRDFSTAFSRSVLTDILLFDDFSHLNWLHSQYRLKSKTYIGMVRGVYGIMARNYRCEYVYKNELINLLLELYGTKRTVYFSEFRIGRSIADIVMFNGESKVFEIKTEYDSPKRLNKQMEDYKMFFDKCYIVIPEYNLDKYCQSVDENVGIIILCDDGKGIELREYKAAKRNISFDSQLMLSCLREKEYENIAEKLGCVIHSVPGYERYKYCDNVFAKALTVELKSLFLEEIKKRNNNTRFLRSYPPSLRQMLLSLNLPDKKANILIEKLKRTIINS